MVKMRKIIKGEGDLLLLADFIGSVECRGITNDDGHGYYATESYVSAQPAIPSKLFEGIVDRSFTHVMWYNK